MQVFNKTYDNAKKTNLRIQKMLQKREMQLAKGQKTYAVEADLRSALSSLQTEVARLQQSSSKYMSAPERFGLKQKDVDEMQSKSSQLQGQLKKLKEQYQSLFALKQKNEGSISDKDRVFKQKYDLSGLSQKQILQLKNHEENQQDQIIDDLINVVGTVQAKGKAIHNQLQDQDVIMDDLKTGMQKNTNAMSRTRAKLMHLLEQSSNCCLYVTIFIEIIAIIAILLFV